MQLFSSLQDAHFDSAWLTIGAFDGVHRGHQEILQSLVAEAHAVGAAALVLSFYPHPIEILRGPLESYYLSNREEKAAWIAELGLDALIIHPFDKQVEETRAADFVAQLKDHLGLAHLWVGHDFTLGHQREGDIDFLRKLGKKLNYELREVGAVKIGGEIVSSSRIRKLLELGEIEKVGTFLGRPFGLPGKVVRGEGRGRSIGIPTANLEIWPKRAVPAPGVYVCGAWLDGKAWPAVTNIGVRPTFEDELLAPVVESHFLDYDGGEFYGQDVRLDFLARLRNEKRFPDVDALLAQIALDITEARKLFAKREKKRTWIEKLS